MAKRSWRYLVIALVALLVFPASMATADDPPSTPPERVYKVDAHLEEYVSGHLELEDWHKVSYLGISDRLTEILGAKYGVALDPKGVSNPFDCRRQIPRRVGGPG